MKTILILLLTSTFIFSLEHNHDDVYLCVSNNSIELERSLQHCDDHYENHGKKNNKNGNSVENLHHCDDYKINHFDANLHFYSLKIKHIKQIYSFGEYLAVYSFKTDRKAKIKKQSVYTQLKRDYNPILMHIKATVLRN